MFCYPIVDQLIHPFPHIVILNPRSPQKIQIPIFRKQGCVQRILLQDSTARSAGSEAIEKIEHVLSTE